MMKNPSVSIQVFESRRTAVIREHLPRGKYGEAIQRILGEVWNYIRAHDVKNTGTNIALYHQDSDEVEFGVEILEPIKGDDRVVESALPACKVVTATHFGDYAQLSKTYDAIHEWSREHKVDISGPFWEIYGHWTSDIENLRTDIYFAIHEKQ